MAESEAFTLCKEERICSLKLLEQLFIHGESKSMSAYPLRVVYRQFDRAEGDMQVNFLISVPKKCFKRAVKRNRVKRQVREAYRKNKDIVWKEMEKKTDKKLAMAFIWLSDELAPSSLVEYKMKNLLHRIGESL